MPIYYQSELRTNARALRQQMTEAERCLWSHLRRKQLLNIQFYRQRPIGNYVVDFYAPSVNIVIEVDGSQHFEEKQRKYDNTRTLFLEAHGLKVLRFNNFEVLKNTHDVLDGIFHAIKQALKELKNKIPPPI